MHLLETAAHWAWETSVAASVLIIPAVLAAFFLRKPIFTPIRHMLGLLIVARLLLPFAISSPLSIFNVIQPGSFWSAASQRRFHFQRPAPAPTESVRETIRAAIPPPNISPTLEPSPTPIPKSISVLPFIWSLGVIVILARVTLQHIRIRRSIRASNQITSGVAAEALHSALELSACRRKIKVYSIPNLSTPALFGLFRPAILLPADLAQSTDFTRLRLVCLHEIAHLKRLDLLINWLAIFAQTLHWFNPLVWLALRRLRADQELLCDGDVMRILQPNEHRAYGETLLALASPRHYALSTLIPVSTSFKQLKERIAMIKQFKPVTHRLLAVTLPALAAIVGILTFTAAANKKPAPLGKQTAPPQIESDKAEKNLSALHEQFDRENQRVQDLQNVVSKLRKELGVFVSAESEIYSQESAAMQRLETDRIGAEQEYVQFNALLQSLKQKHHEELLHIIPTAYRDEALDRLLDKLNGAEQQLATLSRDYSNEHPDVQKVESLIKTVRKQIDARLDGILAGLEAVVGSRQAIVNDLIKRISEMKIAEAETVEKARPYFDAKRDLETHQKFRDTLYLRLLEAQANRAIDP